MRKIAAFLLTVVLLNVLVGCKERGDDQIPTPTSSATELSRPMESVGYVKFRDNNGNKCVNEFKQLVNDNFFSVDQFGVVYLDEQPLYEEFGMNSKEITSRYELCGDWENCVGSDIIYYQKAVFDFDNIEKALIDTVYSEINTDYCALKVDCIIDEKILSLDFSNMIVEDFDKNCDYVIEEERYYIYATYLVDSVEINLELFGDYSADFEFDIYADTVFEKILPALNIHTPTEQNAPH